jgi:hypothetical protein
MTTAVPQYHEKRITLVEMDAMFREYIGEPGVEVDVGETLRLMLGDFFYGEVPTTTQTYFTLHDRIIVFPPGVGQFPFDLQTLMGATDLLGEIFWKLVDFITHMALAVTPDYTHKPHECFYRFYPQSRMVVVYTPVLPGLLYPLQFAQLDGRAVIATCADTLPSWLKG